MTVPRSNGSIAKITRPRISGVFSRTRLFKLLDEHRKYPAVWISSSAGSGKTTLAASYLTEKRLPAIWYQMDEGDADIATFFYYMGRAAAKAAPRKKPMPLFTSEYLQGVGVFTSRYFENLYNRLKPPFLIIFDNYQLVPQDSPLHEVINTGLHMLPEGINIICISREDPPAQFARLRANGGLRLMASEEIRFNFEESQAMVAMKGFEELPEKTACMLYEKTGGWAAGLVLMLERARLKGVESMNSSDLVAEEVFDYFAYEVFEKIDPEIREFLLKTSFMPKMTVSMAKGLTGISSSGNILANLYRSHFFIHRDIQAQPFYQYHPLFQEFLQSRAADLMTPEQVRIIRQASARILEETGQIEDAVGLLLTACDWENLMPLVLHHAPVIVSQGRSDTLEGWLRAFPAGFIDRSPRPLFWMGVCCIHKDPKESFVLFEKAFHLFENQQDLSGTLLAWSGAVNSLILMWDDYKLLDPWVEWLNARIDLGLAFPAPEIEARVASSMAGALVWRFSHRPDIEGWLDRATRLSQEVRDEGLSFQNLFHRTNFYYFLGDFVRLNIMVQRMAEMATAPDASPVSLICLKIVQVMSLATLSTENARSIQLVREGLEISGKSGIRLYNNIFFSMGFFSALNMGDITVADEYLYRMERDLEGGPKDYIGRYYMCYAWCLFLEGNILHARSVAEQAFEIAVEGGGLNSRQVMHHLLAMILHGQRQYDEALRHILAAKELIPRSEGGYYFDYLYSLTEADICANMGLKVRAMGCLKMGMATGRIRGYRSLYFFWQPSVLARLCAMALEHGIEVEYVRELIIALGLSSEGAPTHVDDWPWPVKIRTLGEFELYRDGNPVRFPRKAPKKPLQLLMTIISLGGKNIKNDRLKDILWQEAEDDNAHSSLTSALARLRLVMGNDKAVLVNKGMISLNPMYCWVDAWEFERLADLAEGKGSSSQDAPGDESIFLLEKAINMYGGSFLPGEEGRTWIVPFREHLLKRYCRLVSEIGDMLEKAGRYDEAAKYCLRALDTDDITDEEPYQRLMTYYSRKDQPGRAMEIYMRLKRTLASTLGIKPSLTTENIYKKLIK